MSHLSGQVALVTGGARRLGAAIVRMLHAHGMRVLVHYNRSSEAAASLIEELERARAGDAALVAADLADPSTPAVLAREVVGRFGRLDLLVNNASVFYRTPLTDMTREQWHQMTVVNLEAPLFLIQATAAMLAEHDGSVVNVTDANLFRSPQGYLAYVATKGGLAAATGALARELAPAVRVNAVAPGAILWPEVEPDEAVKRSMLADIPLGRLGKPEEVARAVVYLASASYLTGITLPVDGGRASA